MKILVRLSIFVISAFGWINASAQFLSKASIDHIQLNTGDTLGNIYLNTSGGTSPYTYTWLPGSGTAQNYTNAVSGTYTVTITDSVSNSISYIYIMGYKTDWINHNGTMFRNDSLMSNGACCYAVRTALTKNTLPASTNGWVQHVVNNFTDPYVIGFLDSIYSPVNIYDVDFALHETYSGNLYAWSSGYFTWLGTVQPGDVLIVERIDSTFYIKKNGTTLHSDVALYNKKYKVKGLMEGGTIINLGVSFTDTSSIEKLSGIVGVIDHIVNDGVDTLGKIHIDVKGGEAPYSYLWTPGNYTTKDLANVPIGVYSLRVIDANNDSLKRSFDIGIKTDWTYHYGSKFRNDTLMSDGSCCYSSRTAITKNTLLANTSGWCEYVVETFTEPYLVGFIHGTTEETQPGISDIDFSFHVSYGNNLYAWSNSEGYFTWLGTVQTGDILKVERNNSFFYLKKNGETLHSIVSNSRKLKIKASFIDKLTYVGVSFADTSALNFLSGVTANVENVNTYGGDSLGNIYITVIGGEPPLTYSWSPVGTTTKDLMDAPIGNYTIKVKDSAGDSLLYTCSIGYKTDWWGHYGTQVRNDSLMPDSTCCLDARTALSTNELDANTNGWVEYIVSTFGSPYMIGFLDSAYTPGFGYDMDFAFHETYGNNLYAWSSGYFSWIGTVKKGDVLRIDRQGSMYYLKKNGENVYSDYADASKIAMIKALLVSNPLLKISANTPPPCSANAGPDKSICPGSQTTIGPGVTHCSTCTYAWTPLTGIIGPSNVANIQVSPGSTTTYVLTVTKNNCTSSDNVVVNVFNVTPVSASANPSSIFLGQSTVLAASPTSFVSYIWNPGNLSGQNVSVSPTGNTTYNLTATDANGCNSNATVNVTVINLANNISYAVPKKKVDGGFHVANNNKVYFKFEEEYRTSTLSYKIYDYNNSTPSSSPSAPQNIVCNSLNVAKIIGDNRYFIDFSTCGALTATKYYLLELVNDKNEKFYLKFVR